MCEIAIKIVIFALDGWRVMYCITSGGVTVQYLYIKSKRVDVLVHCTSTTPARQASHVYLRVVGLWHIVSYNFLTNLLHKVKLFRLYGPLKS
jgi:hypothetical protein